MQWLGAALAFATTMLFFSIVVSTLVEMIHRFAGLREKGLQLMLESLFKKVVEPQREKIGLPGNLDAAGQMLGRAYSIAGKVMRGDQLGRKIGFPTANLDSTGLMTPPQGVYAVHAQTPLGRYAAVANIGMRPTLQNPAPVLRVEVHILSFNQDLYGQEIEITFIAKIRDEQRFASLEELKSQIALDILQAQPHF